ncbi:CD74 molecule, major histocompatibility complex, class II invariant chain b [Austrofundulus limnaeus]|uniref:CD74 molecule, major histocompatibility complex, class II invariant chain b n=1 Tax=Austrofundulus limnaeus TaxID=52670 RepID=A0A2I4CXZ5_AUSLI|nr:PREDICTED: H-2 class II histocompatibility antigen gamma chain-like [Austrofundulus limnaeus]
MSDPETQTEPLVGTPAQAPRSSRAYKVAGLTLLGCVLIVGQAAIAYFLLSQKSDIKSLQEQNDKINTELTRGRSASVPVQMHMPMSVMTELLDDTMEEEASAGVPGKTPAPLTTCQQEFAGLKPVQVPGFRPRCDKKGLYERQQCFMRQCWCVNPADGQQIPGSLRQGPVNCSSIRAIPAGATLTLSDE